MFYTVGIFAGADALVVVGEGHDIFAHLSSGQAPAVLPGKGVASAVIVAQRITDLVIGNALSAISRKFIAPIGIAITITVGALGIRGCNILPCQRICVFLPDIAGIVILIDIGCIPKRIIFPDQLVGAVIGVGELGDDERPLIPNRPPVLLEWVYTNICF